MSSYTNINGYRLIIYSTLFATILFIGVTSYYFWFSDVSWVTSSKFGNFLSVLSVLSVIFAVITLVTEYYKTLDRKVTEDQNAQLAQTQMNWIDLEKLFMTHYPYLVRLYGQIYEGNPAFHELKVKLKPEDRDRARACEAHICSILFQIIENVCLVAPDQNLTVHYQDWLKIWRSWFRSPIVRTQWQYMRVFYTQQTRDCVEHRLITSVGIPKPRSMPRNLLTPKFKKITRRNQGSVIKLSPLNNL